MKKVQDTIARAIEQMDEDRKTIRESYDKFAEQIVTLNDYAVNGVNLNKCLELLTKQTAQLLELAKLQGSMKKGQEDAALTESDRNEIYKQLKSV